MRKDNEEVSKVAREIEIMAECLEDYKPHTVVTLKFAVQLLREYAKEIYDRKNAEQMKGKTE